MRSNGSCRRSEREALVALENVTLIHSFEVALMGSVPSPIVSFHGAHGQRQRHFWGAFLDKSHRDTVAAEHQLLRHGTFRAIMRIGAGNVHLLRPGNVGLARERLKGSPGV